MNELKAHQFARYRIATVLFLARGFFSASTIAAFTLTPIIAETLSGSEVTAGLPNTMGLLGRILFAYPLGLMMDRIGRRLALSSGFGIAIIGMLISIWAIIDSNFLLFLVGAFLVGMSRAASDQGRYVAAEVFPLSQRAKVIGIMIFAGTIGSVGGPLLVDPSTNWMAARDYVPEIGPFVVATIAIAITFIIMIGFLFPDPGKLGKVIAKLEAAADPSSVENLAPRTLRAIFAESHVQLALLAMALSYFVMSFVMIITPLHMKHHAHSVQNISLVIAGHTMGMFGLSFLTGWLIDRVGPVFIVRIGTLLLIASCILAPTSTEMTSLAIALFLLGLGWNFCYVAGSSLLSDALAAHERGRGQGASETVVAIGSGIASLSVGLIFSMGSYTLVSSLGLAVSVTLLLATFLLVRNNRVPK